MILSLALWAGWASADSGLPWGLAPSAAPLTSSVFVELGVPGAADLKRGYSSSSPLSSASRLLTDLAQSSPGVVGLIGTFFLTYHSSSSTQPFPQQRAASVLDSQASSCSMVGSPAPNPHGHLAGCLLAPFSVLTSLPPRCRYPVSLERRSSFDPSRGGVSL